MRTYNIVPRYYPGEVGYELILKGKRARYGKEKRFVPALRILHYVREDGMASLPLLFNLMMDDVGEVTIPCSPLVNREVHKIHGYILLMLQRKELKRRREGPRGNEVMVYEISRYLLHLLRRGKEINTTMEISDRVYTIRSLSKEEIMETSHLPFWIVGSNYVVPTPPGRVVRETGYKLNTVDNVNYILNMYGFTRRTKDGLVFKNKEIAFEFLREAEEKKRSTISRIKTYVSVMEDDSPMPVLAKKYGVPYHAIRWWKMGEHRPHPLPERAREWLGLPDELWEKAKRHGIIRPEVEEPEEMEFLLDHPLE